MNRMLTQIKRLKDALGSEPVYVTILYDNGETEEVEAHQAISFALDLRIRPRKVKKIAGENCELFNVILESILTGEPLGNIPEIREVAEDPNNDPLSYSLYDLIMHGETIKPASDPEPDSTHIPSALELELQASREREKQRTSIHG